MGTVFRRAYTDRQGQARKVKSYTIKFKDAAGAWVTEPTRATQRHVAQRLLLERERGVQRRLAGDPDPASPISACGGPAAPATGLPEVVELYLTFLRSRARPSTHRVRTQYLAATLGRLKFAGSAARLSVEALDVYVRARLEAGTAPTTANSEVRYLRTALAWAAEHGLIPANPLRAWKPVREHAVRQRRALDEDEARRLLAASPPHRRVVWATMLATGVRRGEAIALRIDDLDPTRGTLTVRAEVSKTGKVRRIFLPAGLTAMLREYVESESRTRGPRLEACLGDARRRVADYERAGRGGDPQAESWRAIEAIARDARGHQQLFVNGEGLPIRRNNNLLRSLRVDLAKAKIELAGVDLHALRYTCNTTLVRAGVNPAVVRARMGHSSARMTDLYTDVEALDRGGHTEAVARLLGVEDDHGGGSPQAGGETRYPAGPTPQPADEGPLRPPPEVLAGLAERYSNITIGKICLVSEAAVRKWLRDAGIERSRRIVSTNLPEWQIALLRGDLRAAISRGGGD